MKFVVDELPETPEDCLLYHEGYCYAHHYGETPDCLCDGRCSYLKLEVLSNDKRNVIKGALKC